ncbi:MAG: hypothetical protein KTR14_10185 [Vampirovibrio sp.]|nr:hypothetical protein [Vampirovibrio sp.]
MFSVTAYSPKKVLTLVVTGLLAGSFGMFSLPASYAEQAPLRGGIVQTDAVQNNPSINPDDLKEVERGSELEMTVTSELTTGITVEGDEFFAKVSRDYKVDGMVVIPKGTIVHGLVDDASGPKRAGRNGYITTKFDYMITPDGREIPIEGKYSSKDGKLKAAAKVVGRSAGFTLAGGAVGAVMVLKYGGLAAVAATEGYALAGGAAVGGTAGLTASLLTKGRNAMIHPGAQLNVKLKEDLVLPTMNMPDPSDNNLVLDGLEVKVLGKKLAKDPFGEPSELTIALDLTNQTEHTFSFFDIAIQDEYGTVFYASPFGDTGLWFRKLKPNSRMVGNISFNVDNPKADYQLIFFKQHTREPICKIALTDAMEADVKQIKRRVKAASAKHYEAN